MEAINQLSETKLISLDITEAKSLLMRLLCVSSVPVSILNPQLLHQQSVIVLLMFSSSRAPLQRECRQLETSQSRPSAKCSGDRWCCKRVSQATKQNQMRMNMATQPQQRTGFGVKRKMYITSKSTRRTKQDLLPSTGHTSTW